MQTGVCPPPAGGALSRTHPPASCLPPPTATCPLTLPSTPYSPQQLAVLARFLGATIAAESCCICVHICMCACVCICAHVCAHVRVPAYVHVQAYVCVCADAACAVHAARCAFHASQEAFVSTTWTVSSLFLGMERTLPMF